MNSVPERHLRKTRTLRRLTTLLAGVLLALIPLAAEAVDTPADVSGGVGGVGSARAAIPASRQATNLAVITIEGPIDSVTSASFRRRMEHAAKSGADGVVVELHTPGGELGAMLEITSAIKQSTVPLIIAWVNTHAYSAGAVIALACDEIVVSPRGTMGDAAPIIGDPLGLGIINGMRETERAKILSPMIVEVVDSARANGYDERLVMTFLMLGLELWLIEDNQTGKRYCVTEDEYRSLFDVAPTRGPTLLPSLTPGSRAKTALGATLDPDELDGEEQDPATDDEPDEERASAQGSSSPAPRRGSGASDPSRAVGFDIPGLGPDAESAINDPVTGLQERTTRPDFSKMDPSRFTELGMITDGTALLTLTEDDLKHVQLATETIASDQELMQYLGAQHMKRLKRSWSESAVKVMTQGMSGIVIRGLLIVVFLLGLFIEMSMPGLGLPGLVALIALTGLILPPMMLGASNWWSGVVIIAGLLLIAIEIFVIPGFGIPGVLGLVALLVGLVGTFATAGQLFPGQGAGGSGDLAWAMSIVFLAVFVAGAGMFLFSKYTDRFPMAGRLVLAHEQRAWGDNKHESMLEAMRGGVDEAPIDPEALVQIDDVGTTTTYLRPSGTARFDGRLIDVIAELGYVEQGERVRVVSVTKYRVAVERVSDDGGTA